jgi:excisionase family DNA binding protein
VTDDLHARSPRSYSTAEVADRLGVSVPTVQRWVDAGHLLAWKTPGGHRRIDAESAERLFDSKRRHGAAGPAPGLAPGLAAAAPRHRPSVVLVDDNPDDRDLLSAVVLAALPDADLHVYENGIQALVAIGQSVPTVLITDIVMPHMDGLEMLRQLASQCVVRPELIVAVSSNRDEHGAPLDVLPAGVRFVPKPIEPEGLVALLRREVGRR